MMGSLLVLAVAIGLLSRAFSQFPPAPEGVTTIKSKYNNDITISYKEVDEWGLDSFPHG